MTTLLKRRYNYPLLAVALLHVMVIALVACVSTGLLLRAFDRPFALSSLWLLAWLIAAFTAVYWYVPAMSVFQRIRRPIREEEVLIAQAINIVNRQTVNNWQPDIRLKDEPLIYAACYGRNTIIISTGSLTVLSVNEIAAVLAHEQSHLQLKDTMAAATMALTSLVHTAFIHLGMGLLYAFRHLKLKGWIIFIAVAIFLYWIKYVAPFFILAAYTLPAIALIIFRKIMSPMELMISRRTEYARDAYVHHIGLGEQLRSVLLKTMQQQYFQSPSTWEILFRHTHPLTHDRIRRLDKLAIKNIYSCVN